jgi:glycosyltransferase involved in cell wall biosynthesis
MKLAIVIPAYNEATTIRDVVRQIRAVDLPGIEKEIIVVDDGSSDQTAERARSGGALVMRHLVNRGLGGALGTAIEAALRRDADIIVTMDADGQHSSQDIVNLIAPLLNHRADVVIGSRMFDAGGMPWTRRMANRAANFVTLVLFRIRTTDSQSGLRAFSRRAAARIRITTNNYEVSSEICSEIKRRQLRLAEIPIRAIYTEYSLSKGQGLRVGFHTLFRLFLSAWVRKR